MDSDKSYKMYLKHLKGFVFDIDGVLTNGSILVTTSGELLRSMSIRDGYALKTAIEGGFKIGIISGGSNEGVRSRLEGLGIKDIYLGTKNKIEALEAFMATHNLERKDLAYMGDDLPDFDVMQNIGLACCPQDAAPEIKGICHYISHKNGGDGAVRDILEQTLKIHDKWQVSASSQFD